MKSKKTMIYHYKINSTKNKLMVEKTKPIIGLLFLLSILSFNYIK